MLVLSLFPGIGLLDAGFEAEGFTIVRGPDLLWGGNIKSFHPPAGRFDGVIGGPPCQAHSSLVPFILAVHGKVAEDLIPEFIRVVSEAAPRWFLMENVRRAPEPTLDGYTIDRVLYDNRWIGGEQSRLHSFCFGSREALKLGKYLEIEALENPAWSPRVLASGGCRPQQLAGGNGRYRKLVDGRVVRRPGGRSMGGQMPHDRLKIPRQKGPMNMHMMGCKSKSYFEEARRLQGLPETWDLPGFTVQAKVKALGNAVPYPMARALARSLKIALSVDEVRS